jgi:hypothetical protein
VFVDLTFLDQRDVEPHAEAEERIVQRELGVA